MRRVTELVRLRKAKDKAKRSPSRVVPGRWGRIGVIAGAAVVVGAVTWLQGSGWFSDMARYMKKAAVAQTAAAGMIVDDVLLEGRINTPRRAVLQAVNVRRGDPILNVDPTKVAERVAAISWVESVVVERRLPGTLYVKIVEREPMALWQMKGRVALIDRGGVVLTRRDLSKFDRLLTVVGGDAPRHTPALLNMIAGNPPLAQRVRAAVRVGGRRWNLRLDNGIDVSLPQRGAAIAWARLGQLERKHGLLRRDIKAIDLRLPDRLIVRKKTNPAPKKTQVGKKT